MTAGLPQIDCYPQAAGLECKILLSKLPAGSASIPARMTGEGVEFAGVREFVPGDRQRRINWPATTRRGTLQLNIFAAERAQDVVVIVTSPPTSVSPARARSTWPTGPRPAPISGLPGGQGPGRPDHLRRTAELDRPWHGRRHLTGCWT